MQTVRGRDRAANRRLNRVDFKGRIRKRGHSCSFKKIIQTMYGEKDNDSKEQPKGKVIY